MKKDCLSVREVWEIADDLPAREAIVLTLRGCGQTLEEVGVFAGVTRERIRQVERKAFKRLEGKQKVAKALRDYIE